MQPPCNPEYPSQAAIQAGAISALFSAVLGNNSASAVTIIDSIDPKLARQFATVAALAEEQRMVRIWGGIHYPMDNIAGVQLGQRVAQAFIARAQSDGSQ